MRRRLHPIVLATATVCSILSPAAGHLAAFAQGPVIGRASVIDGDTIEIAGEKIRFNGIDAPESWQTCVDRAGAEYRCGKVLRTRWTPFLRNPGQLVASSPIETATAALSANAIGPMEKA